MSVYMKGRGNVRDRDRGSGRGRREVRRRGIWQLLKKKSERDGNLQKSAGGLRGRSVRE